MLVYRIALTKYAGSLSASGRAARWNPNEVEMIYTASSRSLACLENVVHRTQLGLNNLFNVMTIDVPHECAIEKIMLKDLPADWKTFGQQPLTQSIGARWVNQKQSPVLQVPSAIIDGEINFLLNPLHADFEKIKLIKTEPFVFDSRIKSNDL
ncbi:MAG: RES family NAD+ phosphorylase [Mucilaginibacter sp.]|uniref:RES family NAD+ phosphorylase n=1 Tax=Mucilaginibacter sp. TaxID=1882438 RepID=UPI0031B2E5E4